MQSSSISGVFLTTDARNFYLSGTLKTAASSNGFLFKYVDKLYQSIAFDFITHKTCGDEAFALSATVTSGLPITYISSNPQVATISGNMVSIISFGTTNITATQNGNTDYYSVADGQTLNIEPGIQKIKDFDPWAGIMKTYGDAPFALPNTTTSGVPITLTYAGGESDVLSISPSKTATILNAGTVHYTLNVNSNNCYINSISQGVTVNVLKSPANISYVSAPPSNVCDYAIVELIAPAPVSLTYPNSSVIDLGNNKFKLTASGTYQFQLINQRNYANSYSNGFQLYVTPTPSSSITTLDATTFCLLDMKKAELRINSLGNIVSPFTIQWTLNGQNISGASDQSYYANSAGEYSVKLTQYGCESMSSNSINVNVVDCTDFTVSPNPANQNFTIQTPLASQNYVYFYIYNSMGNFVRLETLYAGNTSLNIDTSKLPNGLYTIQGYFNPIYVSKTVLISH